MKPVKDSRRSWLGPPHRWREAGARAAAGLIMLGMASGAVRGATNIVTSTADSGPGSLREALGTSAPGDTVTFGVVGSIELLTAELQVTKSLSIIGPGNQVLAISGHGSNRVFNITPAADVVIENLRITGGRARNGANGRFDGTTATEGQPGEAAGGILNEGSLALRDCVVSGNRAGNGGDGVSFPSPQMGSPTRGGDGGAAGGIYNSGTLSLSNCVIQGNTSGSGGVSGTTTWSPGSGAGGPGGGIYNAGELRIENCVVEQNQTGAGGYLPIGGTGSGGGAGGGIWNGGYLSVRQCIFSSNSTGTGGGGGAGKPNGGGGGSGGSGAGVYSTNVTELRSCIVSNNTTGSGGSGGGASFSPGGSGGSGGWGGGIYTVGKLVMIDCAVFANRSGPGGSGGNSSFAGGFGGTGGYGGGIWCGGGSMAATNCTLAENYCGGGGGAGQGGMFPGSGGAGGSGGGIYMGGGTNLALVACTVANNAPGWGDNGGPGVDLSGSGGGVGGGYSSLLNTIVAGNHGRDPDIAGVHTSLGYNLIGITNGQGGFTSVGDKVGSTNSPLDPGLLPLAWNGGPTPTMALAPHSPAIDAGTLAGIPTIDQRGVSRPQGHGADIGAYEFQFSIPLIAGGGAVPGSGFWLDCCGLPNKVYALEASVDLHEWSQISSAIADGSGLVEFIDSTAGKEGSRFYRLRAVGP